MSAHRARRGTRRRVVVATGTVLALIGGAATLLPGTIPGGVSASAAPADAPVVAWEDPGPRITGVQEVRAGVTPAPGNDVASVEFEYAPSAPAGAQTWTSLGPLTTLPGGIRSGAFITNGLPDGWYDLRAVATNSLGDRRVETLRDLVVQNSEQGNGAADLDDPGAAIRGSLDVAVTLTPILVGGTAFQNVVVEASPSGDRTWTPVTPVRRISTDPVRYAATLDTRTLPDGLYDLRARGTDTSVRETLFTPPLTARRVDNTPPTASLAAPSGTVTGRIALTATARDAGSGVASVRFERARTGTDEWILLGTDRTAPYERSVDTRAFVNGDYDLRAVAQDRAGNVQSSDRVAGVSVANPQAAPPRFPALRNMVAPARDLTILGVAGGEVWAVGTSAAAPPLLDGERLPYTAQGAQPVILRYRDGAWKIADVPRDADGTAFTFTPPGAFLGQVFLAGAMAPTGEAWLWVSQVAAGGRQLPFGLFHRAPGGDFRLDTAATTALGPDLLSRAGGTLSVRQMPGGGLTGLLVSPQQDQRILDAPAAGGGTRQILSRMDIGVLGGGTWSRRTPLPPGDLAIPEGAGALTVRTGAVDPSGATWALLSYPGSVRKPLLLGRLAQQGWDVLPIGLDALDLPAGVGDANASATIATALATGRGSVWIGATVDLGAGAQGRVVGRFDVPLGRMTRSWCEEAVIDRSDGCGEIADGKVGLPSAVFGEGSGEVALAQSQDAVLRFADDEWTRLPTPGYVRGAFFVDPEEAWLPGQQAVGRWAVDQGARPLVEWPQANRTPLLSVAAPGGDTGVAAAGALAVGLRGTTMRYVPGTGWLAEPVPTRASRLHLYSVAFTGPSAFAVGQAGTILRWDGSAWTEDPQSRVASQNDLSAVAFRPSRGEGWAVGRYGTILRFDGSGWTAEAPPDEDAGRHLTSVAVAGDEVFAVAGGNLIRRGSDGSWSRVPASEFAAPRPGPGAVRLVSGLPDGGLAIGGADLLMVRNGPGARIEHASQPVPGIAVAIAATRRADGRISPLVSVAPPVVGAEGDTRGRDVGGVPAGDGDLLRERPDGGWEDMSQAQYPDVQIPQDGVVKLDPVLGIAADPSGGRFWAVGGYAGTPSSSGQGSDTILAGRSTGWDTASIWRFDDDGRAAPPGLREDRTPEVTAPPASVTFAYLSAPECRDRCSETLDAQPDVNLASAAGQIAAFAGRPGGPSFAILGGNARGPNPELGLPDAFRAGRGATEFTRLPGLLDPLGSVPLFAAYGTRDGVPTLGVPAERWADAFSGAPSPFGRGPAPPGISPAGSGARVSGVARHYAFDATRDGGSIRVVVLDNSQGSLEASDPGQTAWMRDRVGEARAAGRPVVVVAYRSLAQGVDGTAASDGGSVARFLASAGVSAVFAAGEGGNLQTALPADAVPGEPLVTQFQGARLSYQATGSYVGWYKVTVDTTNGQVSVEAIPLVESLALKPVNGLSVARSQTLQFQAVARRPRGSLAVTRSLAGSSLENLLGFDNFVSIPAPSCATGVQCIQPSYRFTSSEPDIGDFVDPTAPGSSAPRTSASGRTTPNPASGLFCAFNSGTTTVSVTVGLLTASLPVTVRAGGFGRPCGTVPRRGVGQRAPAPLIPNLPGSPAAAVAAAPTIALTVPKPASPAPAPPPPQAGASPAAPAPAPAAPQAREPRPFLPTRPDSSKTAQPVVPPVLPVIPTPTPPGGASPAQAPRREKAHRHASQSAFSIRPAGATRREWLAPSVAGVGFAAVLLIALGLRPRGGGGGSPQPAWARGDELPPDRRTSRHRTL